MTITTRAAQWGRLGGEVDLLVIGGGITGCGVARDAARRGLSVALVEMRDLAYGTSSRSSKLVHGGVRYLEHYEFNLVFEAVSERRILTDIAPHLVNPLGFLFPVYQGHPLSVRMVNAGLWLYDGLSLFRSPKLHRNLSIAQVKQEEPLLTPEGLKGAPLYWDCATDDGRLTLETALDAIRAGATVATGARVVSFLKDDAGRVAGAVVRDELGAGGLVEVKAKAIVNATGPWTDATISMSASLGTPLLRPTKGVHIVFEAKKLPVKHAVLLHHPKDKRVLFAIPWGDHTYVGTTDTDYQGDPADLAATLSDVDYLVDACNHYFPTSPVARADVISTWAGLRPLIRPVGADGAVDESSVSREHQIVVGQDGLVTIAGGKLTTYRRMAAEVVDTALKLLRLQNRLPPGLGPADTDKEPLPGAVGWPANDDHDAVAAQIEEAGGGHVARATARMLGDTYGMRGLEIARKVVADPSLGAILVPGRPEILAQVDWSIDEELAATVTDVIHRRTQLHYRAPEQGLECVEIVAARMAERLGWDDAHRAAEIDAYRHDVGLSRRWRDEVAP
jgi:glycerol-3-phosphate dehydrogenase